MSENKLVLLCAGLWLLVKVVLKYTVPLDQNVMVGVLMNLFFILLIAVLSIRKHVIATPKSESHLLDDMRSTARPVLKYAVLAALLIGLYNYIIAAEETAQHEQAFREQLHEQYSNVESYKEFQLANPAFMDVPAEEAEASALESFEKFNHPFAQTTVSLMALVLAGLLYAGVTAVIWRKLLG
jgi:hypothetical protein